MSGNAADQDAQFTGKYESAGAAANWLIDRFFAGVRDLVQRLPAPPATVLEVGCGAGFSTQRLRPMVAPDARFVASEFGATLAAAASIRNPAVPMGRESVYALARADRSFDLVLLLEVLEHLDNPPAALAELARVCRGHVVLSTPREPLWCALNMARGKYLADWGNTPGHVNHWSTRGLMRAVAPWFEVVDRRTPVPWSILLLRPRR
jgi:2-polyprenyl-3-methyl-5-hydroxy-6-metoxy-1,4-benzoquinol methylase